MFNFKDLVIMGVCLASVGVSATAWASGSSARARTQQLIIELDSVGQRQAQAAGSSQAATDLSLPDGRPVRVLRSFSSNSLVVELPEEISLEEASQIAAEMASRAGVASVQPNKRFYPALTTPNDPSYPAGSGPPPSLGQWHLFRVVDEIAGIGMPAAWDISTGSASVIVAVLDTGIISHRDLNNGQINGGRILPGYDFYSNVINDNDGMPGRDSDPTDPGDGVNANDCGPGEPAEDSSWHGLSVTGVIVASSDNSLDIAGMDFAARLLPIRVLGRCGGNLADVADAIRWAAGLFVAGAPINPTPANVINLSLSGDGACSQAEQLAINDAVAAGSVVVAAAGNDGINVADVSPANCDNVIVAGAIARDGTLAAYANVGLAVDLAAPGGDTPVPPDPANPPNGILTLFNTGKIVPQMDALAVVQGTSFTTAQVSAVASLMIAVNGALTPSLLEDVIKATTRLFTDPSCNPALCGTGVLSAVAALLVAQDPAAVADIDANQAPVASAGGPYSAKSGVEIVFDGSGSFDPEGEPLTYAWDFGDGSFGRGVAPSHAYGVAGTYSVLLIVNDGVKDSAISGTTATIDGGQKAADTSGGGGGCTLVTARAGKTDLLWWLALAVFVARLSLSRKSRQE